MFNLDDEHFDADEILREPDTFLDEIPRDDDSEPELDFTGNRSIDDLDVDADEMNDNY